MRSYRLPDTDVDAHPEAAVHFMLPVTSRKFSDRFGYISHIMDQVLQNACNQDRGCEGRPSRLIVYPGIVAGDGQP